MGHCAGKWVEKIGRFGDLEISGFGKVRLGILVFKGFETCRLDLGAFSMSLLEFVGTGVWMIGSKPDQRGRYRRKRY